MLSITDIPRSAEQTKVLEPCDLNNVFAAQVINSEIPDGEASPPSALAPNQNAADAPTDDDECEQEETSSTTKTDDSCLPAPAADSDSDPSPAGDASFSSGEHSSSVEYFDAESRLAVDYTTSEPFNCQLCGQDIGAKDGLAVQECLHSVCKCCMIRCIGENSETCPYLVPATGLPCVQVLPKELIRSCVSDEQFERYMQAQLNQIFDQVDYTTSKPFNCQLCGQNIGAKDGLAVQECLHPVCKCCMIRCIGENSETCPYLVPATGLSCTQELPKELIRSCVSDDEFERYMQAKLNQIFDQDVIPNTSPFECSVCMSEIAPGNGIVLWDCCHDVCCECLRQTIRYSEEAEVKCPFMDNDYSCASVLQQREVKAILADQEAYEEYLARTLKVGVRQIPNAFYCRKPDCSGLCLLEDDINLFECPVCLSANCITCRAIHEGLNCRQYQDWKLNGGGSVGELSSVVMIESLIQAGEAMRCPNCKIVLMKKDGCDSLICSMCKVDICWVTRGLRWGPAGRDDTSGGCRCKVNGQRCHPNCNNCH